MQEYYSFSIVYEILGFVSQLLPSLSLKILFVALSVVSEQVLKQGLDAEVYIHKKKHCKMYSLDILFRFGI